jgi:hypothetical protein
VTGSAFCAACGAPTTSPEQRFCEGCGGPLTSAAPPPDAAGGPPSSLGPYRLEAVIAQGGMGVVYRAWDERLERSVALKLLRGDLAADPEFRRRFIHESRGAASLDHPNILPVFDAGEVDGTLYIATRLVDGEDLRSVIAREGALAVPRAVAIAAQIGAALDYAHAQGIVHRDVKPANVLIVPSRGGDAEHAYLIDFGIIKRAGGDGPEVTLAGHFVGTPEYAAPEQILGDPVTGRADQYALGGVLFQCLTGTSAFASPSAVSVMQAHLHQAPPSIATRRAGVAAALDAAVTRAMDKNPARRFATCRAFLTAAQMEGTPAPGTPLGGTVADSRARRPLPPRATPAGSAASGRSSALRWVLAVAAIVAVAGGGTAVATGFHFGARPATPHADSGRAPKVTIRTVTTQGPVVTTTTVAPTPTTTTSTTPAGDAPPPLAVADLTLEPHDARGYRASLPTRWSVGKDDETQATTAGVTRRRTTATDRARGVSVVIDHLTGFDTPPAENRSTLEAAYAERIKGYGYESQDDYRLAGRATYEWRYRMRDAGGEIHRVDLLFRDGAHDFGVMATGRIDYDDLAQLARAVAQTVTVTAGAASTAGTTKVRDARLPAGGRYSGTGTQHLPGEDNHGVRLVMTLGGGATVEYPRLGCTARLLPSGFDGSRRVYRERFTSGTCDDPGTWRILKLSDDRLSASWSSPGDPYTVSATLVR